ncbi:hypothetical protein SMC26_23820 [Actinomadura fulvescens]
MSSSFGNEAQRRENQNNPGQGKPIYTDEQIILQAEGQVSTARQS